MCNVTQRLFIVTGIFGILLIAGCYEDTLDLTLNADGSGSVKQKLVFSERFLVAFEDSESSTRGPVAEENKIIAQIGDAIKISEIKQKDLPDGSRVIELEGTFSDPQQFFLSDYCREQLKLRITPAGDGKAAIYCDMKMSEGSSPSVSQLYAMVKGLYVNRTVHVPGDIEKANGDYSKRSNTVSWKTDLRNKEGLAHTKSYLEGPDAGKGFVIFDASKLKFQLPIMDEASAKKDSKAKGTGSDNLRAEVVWVSVKKKITVTDGDTEVSDLEIGVNLQWDDEHAPVSCYTPLLVSLSDDQGNDLVNSNSYKSLSKIRSHEKNKELKIRANTPAANAKKLQRLQGTVEVITEVKTEIIELKEIHVLAGKDYIGDKVLDKLEFKIKSVKGNTVKISIGAGKDAIVSLEILKSNGNKISRVGSSSWGNEASYDFRDDISPSDTCRIEVVVSKKTVKVPFALDSIDLP